MVNSPGRACATILLATTFALLPLSAVAGVVPLFEFRAGIGYWQPDLSGDIASDGDDFDVEDDLDFERSSTALLQLGVEHPIPLLPNARIEHLSLSDSTTSTLSSSRRFGPVEFSEEESVRSEYDLDMTDLTLYYNPISLIVSLDFGVTVRHIDIDVEVRSQDSDERERAGGSFVVPLGHLGARTDLPFTGLYAAGEINLISVSGHRLQDARAGLGWESGRLFGVEAGYRQMDLRIDDVDDLDANISFGGAYVNLNLRF